MSEERIEYAKPSAVIQDIATFAKYHISSKDIDPLYPVLRHLQRDLEPESALWYSFLYVAYYNIASATLAVREYPKPVEISPSIARLPVAVPRRGLRGGRVEPHISSLVEILHAYGGFQKYLFHDLTSDRVKNWKILQWRLREPWGNGIWAAYKMSEILMKVHDAPIEPPDMATARPLGPREGLSLVFGRVDGYDPESIDKLESQGRQLQRILANQYQVKLGIEELETILCNFYDMYGGGYYIGHDIDELQHQILIAEEHHNTGLPELWDARKASLPNQYLGELHGWEGVSKERNQWYKNTGEIIHR